MQEEKNIRRLRRAMIKEEYIAITGDLTEAVILNQMIYWSERVSDFDKFIQEEKKRCEAAGENVKDVPLLNGWIHKSAAEMKDEIMSPESVKTISRKLNNLVEKGFLERRNNPQSFYDHKYQYRVNLIKIVEALNSKGYSLDGYRVDFSKSAKDKSDNSESENMPESTKGQNVQSKGHSVQTIPETIIDNISIPSFSPYRSFDRKNDKVKKNEKEKASEEVKKIVEATGLESIQHKEMINPLKDILCGIVRKNGEDAITSLTTADIDGVIDRFSEQSISGRIVSPEKYLTASLIKAGHAAKLRNLARADSKTEKQDKPSYDIDEYIRLSMKMLHAEN